MVGKGGLRTVSVFDVSASYAKITARAILIKHQPERKSLLDLTSETGRDAKREEQQSTAWVD